MAEAEARPHRWLYDGPKAVVFAYEGYEAALQKASESDIAKVEATFKEIYCKEGRVSVKSRWESDEGRHHAGGTEGKKLLVQAAKGHQLRVYGVEGSYRGKRAFFISEVDPKKKQDRADQSLLKKAAKSAWDLAHEITGAEV